MAIKVLLADTQPLYIDGVAACLSRHADFQLVGKAESGGEALLLVKKWAPDILIVDIDLPSVKGMVTGVSLIARLCEAMSAGKVIVLADDFAGARAPSCFEAGAGAFILKNLHCQDLLEVIRNVRKGWGMVSSGMPRPASSAAPASKEAGMPRRAVTARELEVVKLVVEGMSSRQVGKRLRLSARTIETHRGRIMRKLGVDNTAGLVRRAVELGLLRESEKTARGGKRSS